MKVFDKIVQIVKADERYSIHGISESGRLYFVSITKDGEHKWKLLCESPEIEKKERTPRSG